jgi:hypothetical protein
MRRALWTLGAIAAGATGCNGRVASGDDASCPTDSRATISCDYDADAFPPGQQPFGCPSGQACLFWLRSTPTVCTPIPDEAGCCPACLVPAMGMLNPVQRAFIEVCAPPEWVKPTQPDGLEPAAMRCGTVGP